MLKLVLVMLVLGFVPAMSVKIEAVTKSELDGMSKDIVQLNKDLNKMPDDIINHVSGVDSDKHDLKEIRELLNSTLGDANKSLTDIEKMLGIEIQKIVNIDENESNGTTTDGSEPVNETGEPTEAPAAESTKAPKKSKEKTKDLHQKVKAIIAKKKHEIKDEEDAGKGLVASEKKEHLEEIEKRKAEVKQLEGVAADIGDKEKTQENEPNDSECTNANCSSCSRGICQLCDTGYQLENLDDSPFCAKCADNCEFCNTKQCMQCYDGYFISKKHPKQCEKCSDHCMYCTNEHICGRCELNFHPELKQQAGKTQILCHLVDRRTRN